MFKNFFDIERLIHSFKTALACIIGALVIKLGHFAGKPIGQGGQWIMISIVIVMCAQISVGGLLQKSYFRLIGTLLGSIIAIIALAYFGDSETVVLVTIVISSFIFSYIATASDNFVNLATLGAVTTIIIMSTQNPNLTYAAERVMEISIGIIIAALVSQFILPIHARTHLARAQANTLSLLRDYYVTCMIRRDLKTDEAYAEYDEGIVKTITKQRQLSKEAAREPFGMFFDRSHFAQTLQNEKQILRSIVFMHSALTHLKEKYPAFDELKTVQYLNDITPRAFDVLIKTIRNKNADNLHLDVPSIEYLDENLSKEAHDVHGMERVYLNGYIYAADMLITYLKNLAALLQVKATS